MSLISASKSPLLAWETLQDTTSELRTGCLALEQSLQEIFQEVEQMRLELLDRLQDVEQERQQQAADRRQLEEQGCTQQELANTLAARDAELTETRSELAQVREALQRQMQSQSDEPDASPLQAELTSVREVLESTRTELDAMRKQRDALQEQARGGGLAQTQPRPIKSSPVESPHPLNTNPAPRASSHATLSAESSLTVSAEQMLALEQEREELEAELELVRGRAAELNETVSLQQREIADQKTELGSELQQLRRLVEKQADLIADRVGDVEHATRSDREPKREPAQPNDPVVNSVMAQFAKLQKDVAQRRRRK